MKDSCRGCHDNPGCKHHPFQQRFLPLKGWRAAIMAAAGGRFSSLVGEEVEVPRDARYHVTVRVREGSMYIHVSVNAGIVSC